MFFIEVVYLIYMFFFFKTKYNYSSGLFDKKVQGLGSFFVHDTGANENKICQFGKLMAIVAVLLWAVRLYLMKFPDYKQLLLRGTIAFDLLCIAMAFLMNFNALIYVAPLILGELYFVNQLI